MYTAQLPDSTSMTKASGRVEARKISEYEARTLIYLNEEIARVHQLLEAALDSIPELKGTATESILQYFKTLCTTIRTDKGSLDHMIKQFDANDVTPDTTGLFQLNSAIYTAYMALRVQLNEEEAKAALIDHLRELAWVKDIFNQLVGYENPSPTEYPKLDEP
jgi:hypothetical protein